MKTIRHHNVIACFLFVIILFGNSALKAQIESVPADTIQVGDDHSPGKALLMSAVIPGAGQIYNRKYWKVPILYGGFAACAYFINFNNKRYVTYRKAYLLRADGDSTTVDKFATLYTESNLLDLKNYYRRNRDLTIIITAAVYVLNLLDSYVDAHLFHFNVNDDLSMKIMPEYYHPGAFQQQEHYAGLKINLSFR